MVRAISRRDVIRQAQALALATPFLSLVACDGVSARRPTLVTGSTMGTSYSVKIPQLPAHVDRDVLERDIARILDTVNQQMSTYRPESELSRFNAASPAVWQTVSPDTLAVVTEALRISRLSDGAFDPTVGPLTDLWGFGPGGGRQDVPAANRIETALRRIGHQHVRARKTPPSLGKSRDDIRIDLSGIAKGFGVDKVAEYLERSGIDYYLVEVGGELRGRGYSPRGDAWRVGIEQPVAAPGRVQRVVRLGRRALATSGDYRIFFEHNGSRYSHIINPRDGRPVDHGLASVTVIASSTMQADALSTALMVLGPKAGLALARREGIAAFFIAKTDSGFVERVTQAFTPYLIV
jgi:thiamine biosynthesis lipoprotein